MSLRVGSIDVSNVLVSGDQALAVMIGGVRAWPAEGFVMTVVDYTEPGAVQRVTVAPWTTDLFIAAWGGGAGGEAGEGALNISGSGGSAGQLITWRASKAGKPVPSYIDAIVGAGGRRGISEAQAGQMGKTTTVSAPTDSLPFPLQASGGVANATGPIKGFDAADIYLPDGTLYEGGNGGPTTGVGSVGAPGGVPGGGGAGGDGGIFGAYWSGGDGGNGQVVVFAINYGFEVSPAFTNWFNSL